MNCKKCDYPLWNLTARVCPECGEPFLPSQFRFALNSVKFCCPHCAQAYYGTGETGHLVPRCFDCVSCARRIDMDEMVLLPAEGVEERQTRPDVNPWLDRARRPLSRWMGALGRGMANPVWLMRSTPIETSAWHGWSFALATHAIFAALFLLPVLLLMAAMSLAGGSYPVPLVSVGIGLTIVPAIGSILFLMLWVATAHGILRLRGPTHAGIGRTALALCFTCGPQLLLLVPCLNFYVGWLGTLWWVIVAGFALAAAQKVSGLRAAVAVAALPVACVALVVAIFLVQIGVAFSSGAATATLSGNAEMVSQFRDPIAIASSQDVRPRHAVELLASGRVLAGQFVSPYSNTTPELARVGPVTLDQASDLSPGALAALAQQAADSIPPGVVAHRLGDFVFVFDALAHADPSLWVAIESWDPSCNRGVRHTLYALTVGGQVVTIRPEDLASALGRQNAARAQAGLSPLPDPASVAAPAPATDPVGPG